MACATFSGYDSSERSHRLRGTCDWAKMAFKIEINELPTDIEILENKWVGKVIDAEPDQVKVSILLKLGSGKRPRRIIRLG